MEKDFIILDLDGLKFHTLPAHIAFINYSYDIPSTEEDYKHGHTLDRIVNKYLPSHKHVTFNDFYVHFGRNFIPSIEWHKDVQPIEDMCEVVPLLAKKYTVLTATARQKSGMNVIDYLLNKYIPGHISGVHCVWEHMADGTFKKVPKKDFIRGLPKRPKAFIDDSLEEILEMEDVVDSYLFDKEGFHDNDVRVHYRVRSWKEIGDTFL